MGGVKKIAMRAHGTQKTKTEATCSCNGCMPVRAVCKPHSSDLKKRRSSD